MNVCGVPCGPIHWAAVGYDFFLFFVSLAVCNVAVLARMCLLPSRLCAPSVLSLALSAPFFLFYVSLFLTRTCLLPPNNAASQSAPALSIRVFVLLPAASATTKSPCSALIIDPIFVYSSASSPPSKSWHRNVSIASSGHCLLLPRPRRTEPPPRSPHSSHHSSSHPSLLV